MFDTALQSIFYSRILPNSFAGTVFILMIVVFRYVTKQWSKGYVRALWILLLAGMLAPPLLHGSFYTIRNIGMDRIAAGRGGIVENMPGRPTVDEGKRASMSADEEKKKSLSAENDRQQIQHSVESDLESSSNMSDIWQDGLKISENIKLWGARIWFMGAAAMILLYLGQYCMLQKIMTGAAFVSEHGYWISAQTDVPFVMPGFLPRIYLPAGIDDTKKENILAHERQHIKNFDPVIKCISTAVSALYWFHPLVWLAVSLMGKDMEMYCDECVMRGKGIKERKDYSTALLEYTVRSSGLTFTMRFGESNTANRIRHILHMKKPHLAVSLIMVLFIGVSGMMFLTSRQSENQQKTEKQSDIEHPLNARAGIQTVGNSQSGGGEQAASRLGADSQILGERQAGADSQNAEAQTAATGQNQQQEMSSSAQRKNGGTQSGGKDSADDLQKEWQALAQKHAMTEQDAQHWYSQFCKDDLEAVRYHMHFIGCAYMDFDGNGETDLFIAVSFKQGEVDSDFEKSTMHIYGYLNGELAYHTDMQDFTQNDFMLCQAEPADDDAVGLQIRYVIETDRLGEQTHLLRFNVLGRFIGEQSPDQSGEQISDQSEKVVRMLSNIPKEDYEKAISFERFMAQDRAGGEELPNDLILSVYDDKAKDLHVYCCVKKNYEVLGTVVGYKGTYSYFDLDIMWDYFYGSPQVHAGDIDGDSAEEIVCTYITGHGTGVLEGGLTVFDMQADHTVLDYTLEEYDMVYQVGKLIRYDRERGKVEIGKNGEIKKEIDFTASYEYEEYADQIEINYSNVYGYEADGSKIKLQIDILAEVGPLWYMGGVDDSWTDFDVTFNDGKFSIGI